MLYIDRHIGIVLICNMEYDIFRNGGYAGKPQPTNGRSPIKNCPWAYPFTTERLKVVLARRGCLNLSLTPWGERMNGAFIKQRQAAHTTAFGMTR